MMSIQANPQVANYEQTLVSIVRSLSPSRAAQLVDFARFLEAQSLADELATGESTDEIEAENVQWDALLASDEAQSLLERLAEEALAEHRAGRTRPMIFTDDGQIAPG